MRDRPCDGLRRGIDLTSVGNRVTFRIGGWASSISLQDDLAGDDAPRTATVIPRSRVLGSAAANARRRRRVVREVSRSAAVLVAVAALAVLASPGPARGQELGQLDRQYKAEREAGRYRAAERIARRGLEVAAASRDELAVAFWCNGLGLALYDQGRYAEAEPLYKRALAIREKALGPDHPDVAPCLNNLARLYTTRAGTPRPSRSTSGRWRSEKALGPDHPDVASSLANLAILRQQGRYAEAEPLYKRALAIYEKALGPDHPEWPRRSTIWPACTRHRASTPRPSRSTSGRWRSGEGARARPPRRGQDPQQSGHAVHTQGRYDEAEPLYKRALAITEKALGPEHPDMATSLNNLALLV